MGVMHEAARGCWRVILRVLVCAAFTSCSSAPVQPKSVRKILPFNLQVRRPPGPGANPHAGPGGEDWTSRPLPTAKLDCESAVALVQAMPLGEIRACLSSLGTGNQTAPEARYRLRPEPVPKLELLDPEGAPECLRRVLPEIPVPREIVFQARVEERVDCYASRLDLEAGTVFGVRMPWKKWNLKLRFPLEVELKDEAITARWLAAAAVTPLFGGDPAELRSMLMPDALCKRCMGEEAFLRGRTAEVEWP
jgi:hypothetical protein